jgi:predicted CXXCH cytochrome family protein
MSKTARSHPTGITPPVNDENLVLTADGTIGCVTCHYAHDSLPAGVGARATKLRVRCRSCHGLSVGHTSQASLVHELRDTSGARAALKAQTRTCIACHDGSSGPDTHVNDGPQMFSDQNQIFTTTGDAPQLGRSHPILVGYEAVAQANPRGYRSAFQMSPIVQFEDGELGCLSCHDLFNLAQTERLVQSNVRSALCLQCHNMSPPPSVSGTGPGLLALARRGLLAPYHGEPVYAAH